MASAAAHSGNPRDSNAAVQLVAEHQRWTVGTNARVPKCWRRNVPGESSDETIGTLAIVAPKRSCGVGQSPM